MAIGNLNNTQCEILAIRAEKMGNKENEFTIAVNRLLNSGEFKRVNKRGDFDLSVIFELATKQVSLA